MCYGGSGGRAGKKEPIHGLPREVYIFQFYALSVKFYVFKSLQNLNEKTICLRCKRLREIIGAGKFDTSSDLAQNCEL